MPSSRDLPHPEIEPASLMSPALAGKFFTASTTWEAQSNYIAIEIKKKSQAWFPRHWTSGNEGQASLRDRKPVRCPLKCSSLESFLPRGVQRRRSHGELGACPQVSRQNLESKLTVAAGVWRTVFNRATEKERAEAGSVREREEIAQLQGRRIQREQREHPHSHRARNITCSQQSARILLIYGALDDCSERSCPSNRGNLP